MKRLILAALGYLAYRNWRKNREPSVDNQSGEPTGRKTGYADAKKDESGF